MNLFKNISKNIFSRVAGFKNWFLKASLIKKAVVVIVIGVILFFATSPLRSSNKPLYITAPVTRNTVSDIVSESGNIVSKNSVDVFSTSTGVIEETYIEDGDTVKAGQNLFKVKSTATSEEKAKAYSDYLNAQNNLNTEKSQMNSLKSALFKANQTFVNGKGVNNPTNDAKNDPVYIQQESDWLQAESNYNNQSGVIKQAETALAKASFAYQNTQNTIMTAPISGTVNNFFARVGEKVTASTSITANSPQDLSPVLIIGDPSNLSITIDINEVDLPKMKVGQKATVKFTAIKDKTFAGNVLSVDKYGTNTNGVVTYNIAIGVNDLATEVAPGMTANIEIETSRHENVLTVPNSAIKAYQGKKAVQVLGKNNKPEFIPVKTGLKGTTSTEIIEGVSEGTQVITSSPKTPTGRGLFGG